MTNRMKCFCVAAIAFTPFITFAQRQVTVKVVDSNTKKPVKEAVVNVKGTSQETKTNFLGFFQVTIDSADTLLISNNDYEASMVKVPENVNSFTIMLTPLPPVSIVGLDTTKAKSIADVPAQFPGGLEAMARHISRSLTTPRDENGQRIAGRVMIVFFVERDGSLTNIAIEKSLHPAADKVALKAIQSMPTWIPAKQNGQPVRSRFVIPIVFSN